ncbi:threalose-6-phosphate phosphatase [Tulasnella sp. UAMH 9824]|nr:threalose-6-phosphate phosphatase [Tulasnella sp. UAMH 9824]
MDSYVSGSVAPPLSQSHGADLGHLREAIAKLESVHGQKGTDLTGRIIHLCHYLPIVSSIQRTPAAPPSPPKTPPTEAVELSTPKASATALPSDKKFQWHLTPRRGHTAMHSGIRSLSATHKQVIVAYTGDIHAHRPSPPEIVGGGGAAPGVETVPSDSLTAEEKKELEAQMANYSDPEWEKAGHEHPITYVPVWLDDKTARGHYDGYCKTTLWPFFHYLLWQDVAHEIQSHDAEFNAYSDANLKYAEKLFEIYQPGDLIWIQDYHLLLAPKFFRNLAPDAHIGLFVHTPFPSSEVFRCLPKRKEILDGMLGANLVCFQTYSYGRHFASSCIRVCGYESAMGGSGVDVSGQVVEIMHCPVGVDAKRVQIDCQRPGIKPKVDALRSLYQGKKIIIGRDKLDVVKGVVQKLKAFEKLLLDFPQWRGNVVLIQVTSPALTDSPKLERQVSELVAHINGEYGSLDFIPVHHYHQHIKKDEFYALLSVADLALITPLRDGMNTTSMEFVLCQQEVSKATGQLAQDLQSSSRAPSPLVMSEFMGISNAMSGGALQINPWNLGDVAASIHRGLTMTDEEKRLRHNTLYEAVTTHTSHTWAAVLVKSLLEKINSENSAHQTPALNRSKMGELYEKAKKRLFMFDYDGTLTPIVKTPSAAVPSKGTLRALEKLSEDPKNVVYIISGRDGGFLDQHLGHLRNVGFSAEHGCFVKEPGHSGTGGEWTNLTKTFDMSWINEVKDIFEYYTERTPGSFIELKNASITWHYRASDPDWGLFQCKQCLDLLQTNLVPKRPIEVLVGKKNLEVRPIAINKGEIVKRLLYTNPDAEWVFCAGDDKTDEDMFRALCLLRPSVVANQEVIMQPPISASLTVSPSATPPKLEPVRLTISPDAVFSTAVGLPTKKTLAVWHEQSPRDVVHAMLELVGEGGESSHSTLPPKDGEALEAAVAASKEEAPTAEPKL